MRTSSRTAESFVYAVLKISHRRVFLPIGSAAPRPSTVALTSKRSVHVLQIAATCTSSWIAVTLEGS
jgi:hypothetical protein